MANIYGADVSTLVTISEWRALKSERSISFAIVRCYTSSGAPDPHASASIINARAAGIARVDVYHFPSYHVDPAQQANDAVDALRAAGARFDAYWIDVEDGGHWSEDHAANIEFLRRLVAAVEAKGIAVGIYSSSYNWSKVTGNDRSFTAYPLWYAHYDLVASFADFEGAFGFGGWTRPAIKQLRGDASHCGVCYDGNWCPELPAAPRPPIQAPEPTQELRQRIVDVALSFVGVGANSADAVSRQKYMSIIGPAESPSKQAGMADTMSGCGLTVAGVWRASGLYEPSLNAPYVIGKAISRLIDIAKRCRAWVPFTEGATPSPGDAVLLEGPDHIFTVVSISSTGSGYALSSVDGGERDASHAETILHLTRTWSGGYDTNSLGTRRRIVGWVDVSTLSFSAAPALPGFVQCAPPGQRGFDVGASLTAQDAAALAAAGYRFCARPVVDLSRDEAQAILSAGLGLMAVAPSPAGGGAPSPALGTEDGQRAAAAARAAGLPMCVNLWLTLDGFAASTPSQAVIDYANAWYAAVQGAGFTAGVIVGACPGVDDASLYRRLSYRHYWKAFGAKAMVEHRGYQVVQAAAGSKEGVDHDDTQDDSVGDRAVWLIATPIAPH